jgi:hypothetical protein
MFETGETSRMTVVGDVRWNSMVRNHSIRNERWCIPLHLLLELALGSLCAGHPGWSWTHCREVHVWAHTEVSSLFFLHSNKWQCPLNPGSSVLMKQGSGRFPWWCCVGFMCSVIICASIMPYGVHLLQALSWRLEDPVHVTAVKNNPDSAGEGQGFVSISPG